MYIYNNSVNRRKQRAKQTETVEAVLLEIPIGVLRWMPRWAKVTGVAQDGAFQFVVPLTIDISTISPSEIGVINQLS